MGRGCLAAWLVVVWERVFAVGTLVAKYWRLGELVGCLVVVGKEFGGDACCQVLEIVVVGRLVGCGWQRVLGWGRL